MSIVLRMCSVAALGLAAVASANAAKTAEANPDAAAMQLAARVCSNCHGPGGNSVSPLFPKLAAQQETYLVAQIEAFKAKRTRGEPEAHEYMHGMAALIDTATVDALARYYARQKAPPGQGGDPALIAKGQQLFQQGAPERQIVPCASCHGASAGGNGAIPRLAGQHAEYITHQIKAIQARLRDSPVMYGIVQKLEPEDIKAVAVYLQSL
ncbi:MAG TPA: c-type cytochrome [Rhodanobacteraceae bacterium]|nr:c-type cytochrome [Rhodanobacteraceae bacterium]